jgi:hypothetical protein
MDEIPASSASDPNRLLLSNLLVWSLVARLLGNKVVFDPEFDVFQDVAKSSGKSLT